MSDFLFNLLPGIYRELDGQGNRSLEALLRVIEAERQRLEGDAAQLYDDWFVETCAPDALPRIAAFLGLDPRLTSRASVANAIASRRRKGTLAALEHAIADATGWPALAQLVRQMPSTPAANSAADAAPPLAQTASTTLHIAVWRQSAVCVTAATPCRLAPGRYTFNPMGIDTPLFHTPPVNDDIERPYTLDLLPHRLSHLRHSHQEQSLAILQLAEEGGEGKHLSLEFADLSAWKLQDHDRETQPDKQPKAFVDPALGRFLLFDETANDAEQAETTGGPPRPLRVNYAYSAANDTGGGPYPRLSRHAADAWLAYVHSLAPATNCPPYLFRTIEAALDAFRQSSACGTIRILDSATYASAEIVIGPEFRGCAPSPDTRRTLTIEALSDQIPCLRGTLRLMPGAPGLNIVLNSLWIDGPVLVGGELNLTLNQCTVRPEDHIAPVTAQTPEAARAQRGIHALRGEHPNLQVTLDSCICGPVRLPQSSAQLTVADSIIDSIAGVPPPHLTHTSPPVAGPPASLTRTTVLGTALSVSLNSEDSIVAGISADATSLFLSLRYGDPNFARLRPDAADDLRNGAANGSEMGAFNRLDDPARQRALQFVLSEFVPYGMATTVTYEP
jgi:hypothetical protein